MFCPYCGASNPQGSAHCAQCGAALTQSQGAFNQQSNYNQPNYSQPNYNQPNYGQPSRPAARPELDKPENVVAGIIAAVVGTAIGALAIILLLQAQIIASIAGFIMAFCALKGYEKFGGKLSTLGIIICSVLILIAPYISYRVGIIWAAMSESPYDLTYSDMAKALDYQLEYNSSLRSEYNGDLVTLYVFTILGGAGMIIAALKKNKKKGNA